MGSGTGYFTRVVGSTGEAFVPSEATRSGWNDLHIRGPAVTALLARTAEKLAGGRPDLRPARATFELFRPALRVPTMASARVVHQSRRLMLVDSELVQDGEVVARAATMFLAATEDAGPGQVWSPPKPQLLPPPTSLRMDGFGRAYRSGSAWTAEAADHLNNQRKQAWQEAVTLVDGEVPTGFEVAAAAADLTNLIVNWSDVGVGHINVDVTLVMARLPKGIGVGVAATHRAADSGIAIGTAILHDRTGEFGSATVATVSNTHNTVIPGGPVG